MVWSLTNPNTDATDLIEIEVSTFENVIGSAHRDVLTGDDRENVIHGGAGDDVLRGGKSDDTLEGGPGADRIDGGHTRQSSTMPADQYMDTASYSFALAGVTVDIASGKGTGGDAMGDTFTSIERFVGSSNDDKFIASEDPDNIVGGAHNADDTVAGEKDHDRSDGDTVSYEKSEEAVTVDLALATQQTAGELSDPTDPDSDPIAANINPEGSFAAGDMLAGIENVMGSGMDDVITGDDNPNELYGGDGDDELTAVTNPEVDRY